MTRSSSSSTTTSLLSLSSSSHHHCRSSSYNNLHYSEQGGQKILKRNIHNNHSSNNKKRKNTICCYIQFKWWVRGMSRTNYHNNHNHNTAIFAPMFIQIGLTVFIIVYFLRIIQMNETIILYQSSTILSLSSSSSYSTQTIIDDMINQKKKNDNQHQLGMNSSSNNNNNQLQQQQQPEQQYMRIEKEIEETNNTNFNTNNNNNISSETRIHNVNKNIIHNNNISSVDYMACCGAGHRLSKLADAYYLSKQIHFALRTFWGYCDMTAIVNNNDDPNRPTSENNDSNNKNIGQVEVFNYLFGSQPIISSMMNNDDIINNLTKISYNNNNNDSNNNKFEYNTFARINNDVPGFRKLTRYGLYATTTTTTTINNNNNNFSQCQLDCNLNKSYDDYKLYQTLRERFKYRSKVNEFRSKYFTYDNNYKRLVIGIHIRAGNGEKGDFSSRGRTIQNIDLWVNNLIDQLFLLIVQNKQKQKEYETLTTTSNQQFENHTNITIFVATDTPSIVNKLEKTLKSKMDNSNNTIFQVVQYIDPRFGKSIRADDGTGVLFGEQGKVVKTGQVCLNGWENTIIDMMLLSYVDVLIAARPSSFTQSLPMHILYGEKDNANNNNNNNEQNNKNKDRMFCEVNPTATEMKCYKSFQQWCCEGNTNFSLQGIQKYEYIRMPSINFTSLSYEERKSKFKINSRPDEGCIPRPEGWKQVCLPMNWSEYVVMPRIQPQI